MSKEETIRAQYLRTHASRYFNGNGTPRRRNKRKGEEYVLLLFTRLVARLDCSWRTKRIDTGHDTSLRTRRSRGTIAINALECTHLSGRTDRQTSGWALAQWFTRVHLAALSSLRTERTSCEIIPPAWRCWCNHDDDDYDDDDDDCEAISRSERAFTAAAHLRKAATGLRCKKPGASGLVSFSRRTGCPMGLPEDRTTSLIESFAPQTAALRRNESRIPQRGTGIRSAFTLPWTPGRVHFATSTRKRHDTWSDATFLFVFPFPVGISSLVITLSNG